MTVRRLIASLGVATLLVACGTDPEPAGGDTREEGTGGTTVEVTAANFAFSPILLQVDAGAEVELKFTNGDDTQHSFTSDGLGVDVTLEGGTSETTTFTAPDSGAEEFHCKFHPAMTGTIAVEGSGAGAGDTEDSGNSDQDLDY